MSNEKHVLINVRKSKQGVTPEAWKICPCESLVACGSPSPQLLTLQERDPLSSVASPHPGVSVVNRKQSLMESKLHLILWCKAGRRGSRSWRWKRCCICGSLAKAALWCVVEGDVCSWCCGAQCGATLWCSPRCLERFGYVEDRSLLKGAYFIRQWGWFCEIMLPAQWSLHLMQSQEGFLHC